MNLRGSENLARVAYSLVSHTVFVCVHFVFVCVVLRDIRCLDVIASCTYAHKHTHTHTPINTHARTHTRTHAHRGARRRTTLAYPLRSSPRAKNGRG
jgi:hypothetical protein